MVTLRKVIRRPHRLTVRPVEAFGDLLECGLPSVLAWVFDGDIVVNLPRVGARAVVLPRHPGLKLLLEMPLQGLN